MSEDGAVDLFLDTSAQFNRHSLNPATREEINAMLRDARITGASSFGRLEFKLSFLRDLAYLHGKLRQFRSIPKVLDHLGRLPVPYDRKLRRALRHLARFFRFDVRGEDASVDAILLAIEEGAFSYWEWFDGSVDYMADGTGCVRSKEGPRLAGRHLEVTQKVCRPDGIRCRVHRFFEEKRPLFRKIIEEIELLPPGDLTNELRNIHRIVSEAEQDPTVLCDDRNCRRIGDALISMDGNDFPIYLSSNAREFSVICRALRKDFRQLLPS